jgi:hypothetical protein
MKNGNNPKLSKNNLCYNSPQERLTANYVSSGWPLVTCGRKKVDILTIQSKPTALSLWYFQGTLSQHLGRYSERNVQEKLLSSVSP